MLKSNTKMSDYEVIKEVKGSRQVLEQYLKDGNTSGIISTLKRMAKINVNETVLRITGIGLYINKLRSQLGKEGSELAKKTILKWKGDVQKSSKPPSKSASVNSAGASNPSTPAAPVKSSPMKPTESTPAKSSPVKPTESASAKSRLPERTPKGDSISYPPFEDEYREKIFGVMYSALALKNEIDGNILMPLALEIENTVFQNAGGVNDVYRKHIATLNFNLRDLKNPELNERVISKSLPISQLCVMSSTELASETKKKQLEDMKKESLFKSHGASAALAETDAFRCGKCKQRKTTYYQKQIRSADEPMTTFVTCVNCDHRWKVFAGYQVLLH